MRLFICHALMISVLCTSVEAAADMLAEGYPHGDDAAHQEEFGHRLDAHESDSAPSELDGDHCEHCCHGHASSILGQVKFVVPALNAIDQDVGRVPDVHNFAQAPPTPPPNA